MKNAYIAMMLVPILPIAQALAEPADKGGERREEFRQKMQDRMSQVDTNGDGAISKSEFIAKSEERFSKLDTNGDGNLSKEEMSAMRGKHKGRKGGGGGRGEAFP